MGQWSITFINEFTYDLSGNIIYESCTNPMGTLYYERVNNYDSIGNLILFDIDCYIACGPYSGIFVFNSDNGLTKDGIAIDDIHIYDNANGIYDGPTMGVPTTQNITGGSNWIHFLAGGKLVASLQPQNLNIGSTEVQAYINAPTVRNFNGQYFLDRNITIKPSNEKPADSVGIRLYFLDRESDSLINATGCTSCPRISSAYELGVSRYSDSLNQYENGLLVDDTLGRWHFIPRSKLSIVPFMNGYYSEFKVKNFSEFWLNSGGLGKVHPLRNEMIQFSTQKINTKNVLAEWVMASENNIVRYEVEVARGNEDWRNGRYYRIGQVNSIGNTNLSSRYSFIDIESGKSGIRYYRIKVIYSDGGFTYSEISSVIYTDEIVLLIYPNPSANGIFNLVYQLESGQAIRLQVFDAAGRLLKSINAVADGFLQKQVVDFSSHVFPGGMYLFNITMNELTQVFRVIKL